MRHLFLLLSFLSSWHIHGQTAQEWFAIADSAYQAADFSLSAKAYQSAFDLGEGKATDYYNSACSHALSQKHDSAFAHLNRATDMGWTNVRHLKRDSDLQSLHSDTRWSEAVNKMQAILDEKEKHYNQELKRQLEDIHVADQTLRHLYKEAEDKFGKESDEMNYFWNLMHKEDSVNLAQVEAIIEQHGWVGRSEVGRRANSALWLVIQHSNVDIMEKYLPLLEESVKNGESKGSHLALMTDRVRMYRELPQIYGSQIVKDKGTGELKVYTLRDPASVNAKRAEVGLGPLEEYAARFGIVWKAPQE